MKKIQLIYALIMASAIMFVSCTDELDNGMDNTTENRSEVQIEITDAPIDNANISGVFVTVAEVKLDGETFGGFSGRKTINIHALQNGRVEALGMGEMNTRTYSNISLVLDAETDAQGNSPGCYVLTADGTKDDLYAGVSGMQEIVISKSFNTAEESRNAIVLDFDLRKTIEMESSSDNETDYEFASNAMLSTSVRAVRKSETGFVKGKISGGLNANSKIVVYAYEKGSYNANSQANSSTEFSAAVTSCIAEANGDYQLSFMEEGEYEIVCASYEDNDGDGEYQLEGTLAIDLLLGLDVSTAFVDASSNTSLNIDVSGMITL